jgi:hypothetical protein
MKHISVLGLILFLSACTAMPSPTLTTSPVVAAPTVIVSTGVLVEYTRVGGIAGFNDRLIIYPDGKAVLTRRTGKFDFIITNEQLKQIPIVFEISKFASLQEGTPKPLVPDELSYVITYQNKVYRTSDTRIPLELQPVQALLNGIIDAKGK